MGNISFNKGSMDKDGNLILDKISIEVLPKGFKYLFIKSIYFKSEKDYKSLIQILINGNYLEHVNKTTCGIWVFYDKYIEFKDGKIEIKAISPYPFEFELACEYRNIQKYEIGNSFFI